MPVPGADATLPEETIFETRPAVLASLGEWILAVITIGIAALIFWIRRASNRYRVTTRRIEYEKGLLSKRTDNLELYRIRDLAVVRPFFQRLVGTANIELITGDVTDPKLVLYGLKGDVEGWFAMLRDATEAERVRRGRMVMEQ